MHKKACYRFRSRLSMCHKALTGVADGARTHDNRNHNPGLYQLSYSHRTLRLYPLLPGFLSLLQSRRSQICQRAGGLRCAHFNLEPFLEHGIVGLALGTSPPLRILAAVLFGGCLGWR